MDHLLYDALCATILMLFVSVISHWASWLSIICLMLVHTHRADEGLLLCSALDLGHRIRA